MIRWSGLKRRGLVGTFISNADDLKYEVLKLAGLVFESPDSVRR
jgi:hypothetical protein